MSLESASSSPPVKRNGAALLVASTALHHRQRQQQQQQQQHHRRRRRQRPKQGGSNSYLQPQQEEEDAKRAKSKKKQRHNMGDPSLLEESFRTFWQVQQKLGESIKYTEHLQPRKEEEEALSIVYHHRSHAQFPISISCQGETPTQPFFPLSPFSLSPSFGRSRITKQRRDKKIGQKTQKAKGCRPFTFCLKKN